MLTIMKDAHNIMDKNFNIYLNYMKWFQYLLISNNESFEIK